MAIIGVAIAVPEPYGSVLRNHRAAFGDPMAHSVPSHVTLLPPVPVAEDQIDEVCATLESVAREHGRFAMRLRGTGTFRPTSPVVFVTVAEGISNAEVVATSVRTKLQYGELDFPYHPHVTVAHRIGDEALDAAYKTLADFECVFEVTSFALYLHGDAAGWNPHREFALR